MSTVQSANELLSSYQSGTFIMLNEGIMKEIGINPNIVLSVLLGRFKYHASKNELDADGSFFCTTEKMEELTTMTYKSQTTAIKSLIQKGLIKVINKQGNKKYFLIIIDAVKKLIEKFSKPVKKTEKPSEQQGEAGDSQKENQNCPKGNSGNDQGENLELPKREVLIYKTKPIKNHKKIYIKPYIKHLNKSSSSKIDNTPSKEYSHKPKSEKKMMTKMDSDFEFALSNFLQSKGYTELLIKQTINEFNKKGITMFTMPQLESAYKKMIHYHNNYQPVTYPHIFLANGMEIAGVNLDKPKKSYSQESDAGSLPFYNWLDENKKEAYTW